MYFHNENIKEHPKIWVLGIVFVCVLVFGYFALPFIIERYKDPNLAARTETMFRNRMKRVNDLCKSLPTPENVNFFRKTTPFLQENLTSVSYFYRTKRQFEEILPTYSIWLTSNGWKTSESSYYTFKKDAQSISFKPYGETLEIYCESFALE